jgi:CBS domain-containing protein
MMTTVRDILDQKGNRVTTIAPGATALEAALAMNEHRIGSLLVLEETMLMGIVTERDILRRVVAAGKDPRVTAVAEILSSPVACCHPGTTLEECRAVMTEKHIRHLPVIDRGRLCGIVAIGDIMAYSITEQETTIKYLNAYMFGYPEGV